MAVYIDDMDMPYRNMIMNHMIADSTEELLEMVDKIGVKRKWIQYPNTYKEHFDVCLTKKAKAIESGAIPITWRESVIMINKRKTITDGTTG